MRAKVIEYNIEREQDYYDLINKVQDKVSKGWEPCGGVAVERSADSTGYVTVHFLQAIIRWENDRLGT